MLRPFRIGSEVWQHLAAWRPVGQFVVWLLRLFNCIFISGVKPYSKPICYQPQWYHSFVLCSSYFHHHSFFFSFFLLVWNSETANLLRPGAEQPGDCMWNTWSRKYKHLLGSGAGFFSPKATKITSSHLLVTFSHNICFHSEMHRTISSSVNFTPRTPWHQILVSNCVM